MEYSSAVIALRECPSMNCVYRAFATGQAPAPRYHHSAVMYQGSMFIFGTCVFLPVIWIFFLVQKKKILHRPVSVASELIPCRPLSWRGWNPIKLVYKEAGWPAQLAASTFNQQFWSQGLLVERFYSYFYFIFIYIFTFYLYIVLFIMYLPRVQLL